MNINTNNYPVSTVELGIRSNIEPFSIEIDFDEVSFKLGKAKKSSTLEIMARKMAADYGMTVLPNESLSAAADSYHRISESDSSFLNASRFFRMLFERIAELEAIEKGCQAAKVQEAKRKLAEEEEQRRGRSKIKAHFSSGKKTGSMHSKSNNERQAQFKDIESQLAKELSRL